MEEHKTNNDEVPTRRQKGISALSVMVLLSFSLIGSLRLREQVCNPNTQTYDDFFVCAGTYPFMLTHALIAGKPIREGLECIFPREE